jgi:hypothetical protein
MPSNNSQRSLQILQGKYGSADYSNWQSVRRRFYSFITYPEAGQAVLTFFGSALGQNGITLEQTNMPKAGSFGQVHFLLKSIATAIKINTWPLTAYDGTDASTLFSDFIMGFVQAGEMDFSINQRPFAQIPKPFLYAPPFHGSEQVFSAGVLNLTAGTPVTVFIGPPPYCTQTRNKDGIYQVDPNIMIEAEQQFSMSISFPSGLVPVLGTGVTDDTTNPLKVGVILDGIEFRPLQ